MRRHSVSVPHHPHHSFSSHQSGDRGLWWSRDTDVTDALLLTRIHLHKYFHALRVHI